MGDNGDIKDWKEFLLREGRIKRMCGENIEALKSCKTKSDAISLYKRTIDWALESDYPSLDEIRKYFPDCERDGIYVDKNLTINNKFSRQQVYVFHNCKGIVNVGMDYDNAVIPMLYFANNCDVTVTCTQINKNPIRVPIYVFGDNDVKTASSQNANFTLYEFPLAED